MLSYILCVNLQCNNVTLLATLTYYNSHNNDSRLFALILKAHHNNNEIN